MCINIFIWIRSVFLSWISHSSPFTALALHGRVLSQRSSWFLFQETKSGTVLQEDAWHTPMLEYLVHGTRLGCCDINPPHAYSAVTGLPAPTLPHYRLAPVGLQYFLAQTQPNQTLVSYRRPQAQHRDGNLLPGSGALKLGLAGFGVKTPQSFLGAYTSIGIYPYNSAVKFTKQRHL